MMRGKRSREEKFKKTPTWWIIFQVEDIHLNNFLRTKAQRWAFERQARIYISMSHHLLCSIHHHTDRTEVCDKRRREKRKESLLLFQRKSFVIRLWKLHRDEHSSRKYPRTVITQLLRCVCWTRVYLGVIIQWPLFKLDSVAMPIRRIQLLLLLFREAFHCSFNSVTVFLRPTNFLPSPIDLN